MRANFLIVICLLMLLVIGCAAFRTTVDDIKADPSAFKEEASLISTGAATAFPTAPALALLAAGYGIAFVRRWYVNLRKKEAKLSTN